VFVIYLGTKKLSKTPVVSLSKTLYAHC